MIPNHTNQELTVLSHLSSKDSEGKLRGLTAYEALGLYRISSLSSRISALANPKGRYRCKIKKVMKKDNTGKRYVRYYLASAK